MIFNPTFDIGNIISCLSIFVAIISGIIFYLQWKKSISMKRAEYVNTLIEKTHSDSDISEIMYLFEYGRTWYTGEFHNGGEIERKIDKTLFYYSYICYLYDRNLITKKEFNFCMYEIE